MIASLKPSEHSRTYMDMATHHHLDTGPRGQPWWCYSFFAQPNDQMATQQHYLLRARRAGHFVSLDRSAH